jgi:predicted neuraminidase
VRKEIPIHPEFVSGDHSPTPSCHAATIAETGGALVAAWFGGEREGHPSVGIWVSRNEGGGWSAPIEAETGATDGEACSPCWNPVLFQPRQGPLLLFYKVGPRPAAWWGMLTVSGDGGRTWGKAQRLPNGMLGPIKNRPIELPNGTLLCPSSSEDRGWRLHFELTCNLGTSWERTAPLNDGWRIGAIQPTILRTGGQTLRLLCRSRHERILTSTSDDLGRTWSRLAPLDLPNPNSGIDAVTLADDRHVLVFNNSPSRRSPLSVAISSDGISWRPAVTLEEGAGEYSYPAVIQTRDGRVHVVYSWNRCAIKHVVLDPGKF